MNITKNMYKYLILIGLLIPQSLFAAPTNLSELIGLLGRLINLAIPLLFSAAVLLFLFGILRYIFLHPDDPKMREQGRDFMMWGLLAMFVMVSFWGLVNLLTNTFFGVDVDRTRQNLRPNDASDIDIGNTRDSTFIMGDRRPQD